MLTLGEAWVFTFKWWNVGKEEKGILTPDSCSISSVWIRTYELGFRRDAVGKMKFLMLRGVLISLSFSSCGFFSMTATPRSTFLQNKSFSSFSLRSWALQKDRTFRRSDWHSDSILRNSLIQTQNIILTS